MLSLMHIQKCVEKKELVYFRLKAPLLETNQCTQLSGAYKQCNHCQYALMQPTTKREFVKSYLPNVN